MKLLRKKMNKKGFSLIELIVVIAILAIIAAIAIPRFATIMANSEVKSDIATAEEICNMARLQEVELGVALVDITDLDPAYMEVSDPQSWDGTASGAAFALTKIADTATDNPGRYQVTFTHNNGSSFNATQTIVENVEDIIDD